MPAPIAPIAPVGGVTGAPGMDELTKAGPTGGVDFAAGLRDILETQAAADTAAEGLATGSLENIHDYTVAAAKAQVAVEMTTALRNRAVEAFQEIMRTQV